MRRLVLLFVVAALILPVCHAVAGGTPPPAQYPPLDYTLMAFKEQGVWYFPCVAPMYPVRIPPHYLTFGPPPPPCPPPPMCLPPAPPCPAPIKKVR